MEKIYSKVKVEVGKIIQMDDTKEKFIVKACYYLGVIGHEGYQLNLVRIDTGGSDGE